MVGAREGVVDLLKMFLRSTSLTLMLRRLLNLLVTVADDSRRIMPSAALLGVVGMFSTTTIEVSSVSGLGDRRTGCMGGSGFAVSGGRGDVVKASAIGDVDVLGRGGTGGGGVGDANAWYREVIDLLEGEVVSVCSVFCEPTRTR